MFQYYDLSPDEFENLTIAICKEILGTGAQGFAKGADGGKDGYFSGKANLYPSITAPWKGITLIQAKHTTGINKHFSESDFFSASSKSCVLATEVIKVKQLVDNGELNNYIIFSNRKLTGNALPALKSYISENTNLNEDNIGIIGIEELDYWVDRFKYILDMKSINLCPLLKSPAIRPDELAEIISHFSDTFPQLPMEKELSSIARTSLETKNQLNNMRDTFSTQLCKSYMKDVYQVSQFLNDPQNAELQKKYLEAVNEFQYNYILPKLEDTEYFDNLFNELVNLLVSRDFILSRQRRLTRLMVFYMYWNCDIGKSNDNIA